MNKKELKKQDDNLKEMPFASMIIQEYKESNKGLRKAVSRLTIIAVVLLVMLAVETTYIVIYWDSLHPYAGAIRGVEYCEPNTLC